MIVEQALLARDAWMASFEDERGDEHLLHFSDLTGCPREVYLRREGEPRFPMPRFVIPHLVERAAFEAIERAFPEAIVRHGHTIEWNGLVGHLDIDISDAQGNALCVIDVSTTARREPLPNDHHTLKTAAYAYALGAPDFIEWVFCVTRTDDGRFDVAADQMHPFKTADFVPDILAKLSVVNALATGYEPPEEPPAGMEWKCAKYCAAATCSRNGKRAVHGKVVAK